MDRLTKRINGTITEIKENYKGYNEHDLNLFKKAMINELNNLMKLTNKLTVFELVKLQGVVKELSKLFTIKNMDFLPILEVIQNIEEINK
ncbi:MAG: hypothetical protein ACRC51_11095 [Cetobacterium sp.]